ncbi:MAG: CcmD family protein [Desulfovibrionaceae bacterium]
MTDLYWLLAANVVVWLGLGAYLVFIGRVQKSLDTRLHHWEILKND